MEKAQTNEEKGGRYVPVPREAITERLERAGFLREPRSGEVTYSRVHDKDKRLVVMVYTSIAENAAAGRGCGEDAIRAVALFTWTRQGETEVRRKKLFSGRVFRVTSVEGVLNRMMAKAREAYAACNDWIADDKRRRSGAPAPLSGAEWRAAAEKHADAVGVVGSGPLWSDEDENDLLLQKEGKKAFERGEGPCAFVERIFAEDLARMEHEREQRDDEGMED